MFLVCRFLACGAGLSLGVCVVVGVAAFGLLGLSCCDSVVGDDCVIGLRLLVLLVS